MLAETDLTFEKAYKIAVAAETTSKNVQDLQTKVACNQVKTEGTVVRKEERCNKNTYQRKQHSAA